MVQHSGFGTAAIAVMAIAGIGAATAGQASAAVAATPPAAQPSTVPASPAPSAPVEVKVKAWNMYQLPNILNAVSGTQAASDARVRASVDQLAASGADVLLLSEVNGTAGRAILDGLKEQGYTYQTPRLGESCAGVFGACSDAPWSVNGGVAVVSKYPIAQSEQYVYTNYAPLAPDMFANKGAVLARIEKDGQQFWVVATHTQADDTINDRASGTHDIRMKQAAELRRFVDTFAADGAPVIYGGDFNTEYFAGQKRLDAQGRTEFQQLLASSGINLFDPGALPYTYDSVTNSLVAVQGYKGYRDTLDYVGTTGGAAVRWVQIPVAGPKPVSDHEPVIGSFEITRADGSIVRTGVDPRSLNPTPIQRAVYFVQNSLETAARIVLITAQDAVTAVQKVVTDLLRPQEATVTVPTVAQRGSGSGSVDPVAQRASVDGAPDVSFRSSPSATSAPAAPVSGEAGSSTGPAVSAAAPATTAATTTAAAPATPTGAVPTASVPAESAPSGAPSTEPGTTAPTAAAPTGSAPTGSAPTPAATAAPATGAAADPAPSTPSAGEQSATSGQTSGDTLRTAPAS